MKRIIFIFVNLCLILLFGLSIYPKTSVIAEDIGWDDSSHGIDNGVDTTGQDKKEIDTTPATSVSFELIGKKKDFYTGEIYNQFGDKVTDFKTDNKGEYLLSSSLIKPTDNKIYIYLTSQEGLIPQKKIGGDFKTPMIPITKDRSKQNIAKININVHPSSFIAKFKLTFIDKLFGSSIQGIRTTLKPDDGGGISKVTNSSGEVKYSDVYPGQYTFRFSDFKQQKFILLTNNNQNFMSYNNRLVLNSFSGPPWQRETSYIISTKAITALAIPIIVISLVGIYVSLGFMLPKNKNIKEKSHERKRNSRNK